MEGFQDTFRHLYNGTTSSDMVMMELNASTSDSGGNVCSSGNGASSDFTIVSSNSGSGLQLWEWSKLRRRCPMGGAENGARSDFKCVPIAGVAGRGLQQGLQLREWSRLSSDSACWEWSKLRFHYSEFRQWEWSGRCP